MTTTVPLSIDRFGAMFQGFNEEAFRFESLDQYLVNEEQDEFQKYLDGELLQRRINSEWCDFLRSAISAGKAVRRVHAVTLPLSPYVRFEIEWGYAFSADGGEDIHMLNREEIAGQQNVADFWLFDESDLVLMNYDRDGRFEGVLQQTDQSEIARHVDIKNRLLSRATPLKAFVATIRRSES